MEASKTRGLSGGALKLFALVTMLIDHIGYIFAPWGLPLWLRYIGRLSAPVFFFLFIEGFMLTHDRRKYFLRLYIVATGMNLIRTIVPLFYTRWDGFFPENAIFSTFAVLVLMLSGIELLRRKRAVGIALLLAPLLVAPLFVLLISLAPGLALPLQILRCFLPDAAICEGGYVWVGFGLLLYAMRRHGRTAELIALAAFFLLIDGGYALSLAAQRWSVVSTWDAIKEAALYYDYQWMAAFSVIPLALYNGERGRVPKQLFYIFYPAHVYILFIISCFM